MTTLDDNNFDQEELNQEFTSIAKENFIKSAGWVKIIAIIGFVISALGIIGSIVLLFSTPLLGLINLLVYGCIIYVSTLLLKISTFTQKNTLNLEAFSENYYKFWKFTVIFMIILVGLVFIAGLILGFGSNTEDFDLIF